MTTWWKRMAGWRRLLLGLYAALLIVIGASFIFDFPIAWWTIPAFVLSGVGFVMYVREGLRAPVPGREDLDKGADDPGPRGG